MVHSFEGTQEVEAVVDFDTDGTLIATYKAANDAYVATLIAYDAVNPGEKVDIGDCFLGERTFSEELTSRVAGNKIKALGPPINFFMRSFAIRCGILAKQRKMRACPGFDTIRSFIRDMQGHISSCIVSQGHRDTIGRQMKQRSASQIWSVPQNTILTPTGELPHKEALLIDRLAMMGVRHPEELLGGGLYVCDTVTDALHAKRAGYVVIGVANHTSYNTREQMEASKLFDYIVGSLTEVEDILLHRLFGVPLGEHVSEEVEADHDGALGEWLVGETAENILRIDSPELGCRSFLRDVARVAPTEVDNVLSWLEKERSFTPEDRKKVSIGDLSDLWDLSRFFDGF